MTLSRIDPPKPRRAWRRLRFSQLIIGMSAAVMATAADIPMINWEKRSRRQGRRGLGGSMTLSRIDQPAGPSSS
ncbi:hypothetical protein PICSAR120_02516 [Mycobacterium avium subsp. paratuberculosis]|nr:hypothetical protein PICSAR120_02516 [Mycobacterium avium subsp. paratuberculosis]